MTTPSIASQVGQSLYIHGYFASAITFNDKLFLQYLPDTVDIVTVQVVAVHGEGKINFLKDLPS